MDKVKNFFRAVGSWFKNITKAKIVLFVSLALILVGGFVGSMIQTDFFRVSVYSQTIETEPVTSAGESKYEESGVKSWVAADIFRPKSANADNPVPLVFVVPGIQRTKETQASFCIELARRGYGVICIDPYNQGESSSSYESQSATQEGYGLFAWMDYLFEDDDQYTLKEEFGWIDSTRIGACGHSAGGNACQKFAEREGRLAIQNKKPCRVNGIYITGYIRDFSWTNTVCNVGVSYSSNDEGAFQNKTAQRKNAIIEKRDGGETLTQEEEWWLTVGNGDLRYADESVSLVNYQLKREKAGLSLDNYEYPEDEADGWVRIGYEYGNPYKGTYTVINNETALHAMQPYDGATLTNLCSFFEVSFDEENSIAPSSHIWIVKEIGGGMTLAGGFAFICSLFLLLLNTKLFASLKKELPARTGNQKIKGRVIFWISFAVSAVIACVLYMACVHLSVVWFPQAAASTQTWFFPQRFTNAVMLWALFNGLIGIAIFFITWGIEFLIDYLKAKKAVVAAQNGNPVSVESATECNAIDAHISPNESNTAMRTVAAVKRDYISRFEPLKLGKHDIWKTLLLAAILVGSFFALDYIIYGIFHVDMRFFFISARVSFSGRAIAAMLMYIPAFFVFYFSNSFRVNCCMRPENWKEWLSQIIAVLGNTVGLIAIVLIQYIPMLTTGQVGYTSTEGPQWLFVNLLFSIIPMMVALPLFNRFFFNKTGRAWLGPIVTCFIFIIMTGGATTIYFAL